MGPLEGVRGECAAVSHVKQGRCSLGRCGAWPLEVSATGPTVPRTKQPRRQRLRQEPHAQRETHLAPLLLIRALRRRAYEQGHTIEDLANAIDVHPSHWYRLNVDPSLLSRCERKTLDGIARYLDWPIGRILLASGAVTADDFEIVLAPDRAIEQALSAIEGGPYGTGLRTPLRQAAPDHQRLIAELYLASQTLALAPRT